MTRRPADFPFNPFFCWIVASVLLAAWWTWFLPVIGAPGANGFWELLPGALVPTALLLSLPPRTVAGRLEWARQRAFDTWRNNAAKACHTAGSFAGTMTIAQIEAERARWNSLRNPQHRSGWFNQWAVRDGAGDDSIALVNRPANSNTSGLFYAGRVFFAISVIWVVAILMQPLVVLVLLPGGYAYLSEMVRVFIRTNSARK